MTFGVCCKLVQHGQEVMYGWHDMSAIIDSIKQALLTCVFDEAALLW
jgi:hypothetical protein